MIEYKYDALNISSVDMKPFFGGWSRKPATEKRLEIIQNCSYVIFAIENKKVVGFINAISDKTLSAYIPLLEVVSEYRKRGIGRELVKRMLEQLKDFYMIDICCDRKLVPYYEKLGFTEVSGMIKRNYSKI